MEQETFEKIKRIYEQADSRGREIMEQEFPELRESESEDERIRRTLVEYFGPKVQLDFVRGIPIQKIRDWLDKQKEQKPVLTAKEAWKEMRLEVYAQASGNRHEPNYSDDSTKMFSLCDIDEIFEKIGNSTVEQKPAWSEDIIRKAVKEIGLTQHQIDWFKTNVFPPKQEWSEVDEKMLTDISWAIRYCAYDDKKKKRVHDWFINRLESLRPPFKPSEEQEEPEYYQHFDPDC